MKTYDTEVAIIGAGPIGLEMAGVLSRAGIPYLHFEAGQIGQTLVSWPPNTQFFSSPEWIGLAGIPLHTREQGMITAEEYLTYMRMITEVLSLDIRVYHRVTGITRLDPGFRLEVTHRGRVQTYTSRSVILAVGDMAFPRTLGIPGEDQPHVSHYFSDPHRYFHTQLTIVGGANSAMEALVRSWRAGAQVTLVHRGIELDKNRIISRLMLDAELLIKNHQVRVFTNAQVQEIHWDKLLLTPHDPANPMYANGTPYGSPQQSAKANSSQNQTSEIATTRSTIIEVPTDFVYLATGFEPDQSLLTMAGCTLEGARQVPVHDPHTMETDVKGVYVVGTCTAGNQNRYKVYIATCHQQPLAVLRHLAPEVAQAHTQELRGWVGNIMTRDFPVNPEDLA
jgi:thioredoxin reductase (NADPH)